MLTATLPPLSSGNRSFVPGPAAESVAGNHCRRQEHRFSQASARRTRPKNEKNAKRKAKGTVTATMDVRVVAAVAPRRRLENLRRRLGGAFDSIRSSAYGFLDDVFVLAALLLWRTLFAFSPVRLLCLVAFIPILCLQNVLRTFYTLPPWYILLDSLIGYLIGRKKAGKHTLLKSSSQPPTSSSPARSRRSRKQANPLNSQKFDSPKSRRADDSGHVSMGGMHVSYHDDLPAEVLGNTRTHRGASRAAERRSYGCSTSSPLLSHSDNYGGPVYGSPDSIALRRMKSVSSFPDGRSHRRLSCDDGDSTNALRRQPSSDTRESNVSAVSQFWEHDKDGGTTSRESITSVSTTACMQTFGKTLLPRLNRFTHIRSEEGNFKSPKNWRYSTSYLALENGFKVAYYDVGQHPVSVNGTRESQPTVVCLHGSCSWSYMYRKFIPVAAAASFRVLSLDLPGFGNSDKIASLQENTALYHVKAILSFLAYAASTSPREFGSGDIHQPFTMIAHGSTVTLLAMALKEFPLLQAPWHQVLLLSPYLHPVNVGELDASTVERLILLAAAAKFSVACRSPSTAMRIASHTASFTSLAAKAVRRTFIGDGTSSSDDELAGYDAPYAAVHSRAGPATLPLLPPLPIAADPLFIRLRQLAAWVDRVPLVGSFFTHGEQVAGEMAAAKEWLLNGWSRPGGIGVAPPQAIYGTEDPVCKVICERTRFSRAVGIKKAGHFILEDSPDETISRIMDVLRNASLGGMLVT